MCLRTRCHLFFFLSRHLYYKQMWHDLKSGQLHLNGHEDKIPKIVALVVQAEYGDQTTNVYQMQIYENVMSALLRKRANENVLEAIMQVIAGLFLSQSLI